MTYIAELDLNGTETMAATAHGEHWDDTLPEWRVLSVEPEHRDVLDYRDVLDADTGIVRGFGGDHRRYFPGAFGV